MTGILERLYKPSNNDQQMSEKAGYEDELFVHQNAIDDMLDDVLDLHAQVEPLEPCEFDTVEHFRLDVKRTYGGDC